MIAELNTSSVTPPPPPVNRISHLLDSLLFCLRPPFAVLLQVPWSCCSRQNLWSLYFCDFFSVIYMWYLTLLLHFVFNVLWTTKLLFFEEVLLINRRNFQKEHGLFARVCSSLVCFNLLIKLFIFQGNSLFATWTEKSPFKNTYTANVVSLNYSC